MKKQIKVTLVSCLLILAMLFTTACNALLPVLPDGGQTGESVWETLPEDSSGALSYVEYLALQKYPEGEALDDPAIAVEILSEVNEYAIELLAFDIRERGFEVFRGIATTSDGKSHIGLVFTDGSGTYDLGGETLPTAGFLSLVGDGGDAYLTDEEVSKGVVAVVGEDTFLVDRFLSIDSYSGVINNCYFAYRQVTPYAMEISVEEITDETEFDFSIDCYSFDEHRTLWLKEVRRPSLSASSLYSEDEAYSAILQSLREMIAIQKENHCRSERTMFVAIDPAILDALNRGLAIETLNDYLVSELNSMELAENQFLVLSATEGVQAFDVTDFEEMVAQRRSNGWMQIVLSTAMLVGSVVIACVSLGSATPAVITSIACVSGGVASVVAVSNLIEGVDNVRLANLGDITSAANNPIRNEFVKIFGEDGVAIYNAVGIAAMAIQSLTIPVAGGIRTAASMGGGAFRTTVQVVRAVGVTLVQEAVIGAASTAVALKVEKLTLDLTGNQIAADWHALFAAFATGIVVGVGVSKLDQKFNFSGLYTKPEVVAKMLKKNEERAIAKMSSSNWASMGEATRKRSLNQLAKFVAKDLGLDDVPTIKYFYEKPSSSLEGLYGYFNPNDGSVNINLYFMDDPVTSASTLAHEMSHYRQHQWLNQGVDNDVTRSLRKYISPGVDQRLYQDQPCEIEARQNGDIWGSIIRNSEKKAIDWTTSVWKDGKLPLQHLVDNHSYVKVEKPEQGLFHGGDADSIRATVDEAWLRRGNPTIQGDRYVYFVPMENAGSVYRYGAYVGEANAIKIVVGENDGALYSAYPVIHAFN